jgi:hypothetical protein
MRLLNWAGIASFGVAFAAGFAANEVAHRHTSVASQYVNAGTGEELCDAVPPPVCLTAPLSPPQPVEEIDLTCQSMAFGPQSTEPPLAGQPLGSIRTVSFELPAGSPEGPDLPPIPSTMPYLTDDPAPATLPPLGDVPPLTPVPESENPLLKAVKKYFENGGTLPEQPAARGGIDRRRDSVSDVTDKIPLGQPPVSEHPSAVPPNKP